MSRPAESNGLQVSWAAVLVIVYICSLPGFVMNFVPLLVSAMVASFDLSEQQSGFIASADMAGYTVGAVAAFFIIEKANWRQLTRYSLFLMMLANVISSQVDGFSALLVLRFLSGVGGGMMTAVMLSVIAQMCNPDAVYGLWFAVMSLITIVGMALFPEMLEKAGLGAAFFTLAAMLVVCLPFLNALPQGASNTRSKAIAPAGNKPAVLLILASVFVLTTGIGSSWAFLGQIGSAAGLSVEQVSYSIAASAAGDVIGGISAGSLALILGRILPISFSCAGLAAAMLFLMLDKPSYLLYTLCCFAFYGLWSFVLPYLLGALAELEQSGRALSLGSTAQGAGFMAGPFFASLLLYRGG
ncbi:MFS transporter [Dasania marina]|uniref:MFS transporter n=1 Tax=Dasania marina TaxID=471499 RepID=UPI0030DB07AB|tara:strand:- start:15699 stop:16766 length:1068 start_codon:yes stop_codon:yes gene_type:complete